VCVCVCVCVCDKPSCEGPGQRPGRAVLVPPHRGPLWQQCGAVYRGRRWRSPAWRHAAAAGPRCRRYQDVRPRAADSVAPTVNTRHLVTYPSYIAPSH